MKLLFIFVIQMWPHFSEGGPCFFFFFLFLRELSPWKKVIFSFIQTRLKLFKRKTMQRIKNYSLNKI